MKNNAGPYQKIDARERSRRRGWFGGAKTRVCAWSYAPQGPEVSSRDESAAANSSACARMELLISQLEGKC